MNTSWNLPPGCTQADIDRAMGGDEPQCFGCGTALDEQTAELVWWRGREYPACDRCAFESEEER